MSAILRPQRPPVGGRGGKLDAGGKRVKQVWVAAVLDVSQWDQLDQTDNLNYGRR